MKLLKLEIEKYLKWRHDTQYNDTSYNNTQHIDTQQNAPESCSFLGLAPDLIRKHYTRLDSLPGTNTLVTEPIH
jgi:hypothetical protein